MSQGGATLASTTSSAAEGLSRASSAAASATGAAADGMNRAASAAAPAMRAAGGALSTVGGVAASAGREVGGALSTVGGHVGGVAVSVGGDAMNSAMSSAQEHGIGAGPVAGRPPCWFATVFVAIFCPPLAVLIVEGLGCELFLNCLLMIFMYLPGYIHAMIVVFRGT